MGLSMGEILLIVLVILVLFGAQKLPELGRSLGRALKEFKSGLKDGGEEKPPAARKKRLKKGRKR